MKTFKSLLISYLELVVVVAFSVTTNGFEKPFLPSGMLSVTWLITGVVLSGIFAIWVAVFTWKNYRECISRSFIWRNSNVSILASKFGYTWQRFVLGFIAFGCTYVAIIKLVIE